MRLSVFHSLAKTSGRLSGPSLSKWIQECANQSLFQGIELDSSQVTNDVLDQCSACDVQVLTRLVPDSIDDAFRQLDGLSSELSKVKEQDVGNAMRLIVIHQKPSTASRCDLHSTLDYLSDILPFAAQFMETHPSIGQSKGERNAHGKPIDDHVLGVCHQLSPPKNSHVDESDKLASSNDQALQYFLDILDVLPPTRLSLDVTTLKSLEVCIQDNEQEGDVLVIEPLIQSIDHFDFLSLKDIHQKIGLHQQVWKWQNDVRVKETYASCEDKAAASSLHNAFQKSV